MITSQRGVDLIKRFEGLTLKAVRLQGEQYYTIGYGHYGADVQPGQTMTQAEAEALLRQDLQRFETWVRSYCSAYAGFQPNQNQFDALVSFTYNLGPGNLKQLVTARTAAQVAAHMLAYTGSGSEIYRQGLINRRTAERALFLEPAEGEENMTGKEIFDALTAYLNDQTPPTGVQAELDEAIELGVWDGTTPTAFAPVWRAVCYALRAAKKAATPEAPILALVQRIHELQSQVEKLEREKQDLKDEINVLYSDVQTAKEGG